MEKKRTVLINVGTNVIKWEFKRELEDLQVGEEVTSSCDLRTGKKYPREEEYVWQSQLRE